jgi:heptose I phosphotransferase
MFLKLHRGVGWKEVFKNLLQLRLPVVGAGCEYRALAALRACGINCPRVLAYGERGYNPARRDSFLLTAELADFCNLQDYFAGHRDARLNPVRKWELIESVARISRTMHAAGINHRDFYLWHFFLDTSRRGSGRLGASALSLLDPHRARIRTPLPRRWLCKDLGSLYFSSRGLGFTRRDILRFIRAYAGPDLRRELYRNKGFWSRVGQRADRIARREQTKSKA